jgi:hypothetical protein
MKRKGEEIEFDTGGELDERHPAHQLFSASKKAGTRGGKGDAKRKKDAGKKPHPAKKRSPGKISRAEKPKSSKAGARAENGVMASLSKGDRKVIEYLDELKRKNRRKLPEDGDCVASLPEIAEACDISTRQVQNCTQRLIAAGLLRRVGYDFSNSNRDARGTIFKVLL